MKASDAAEALRLYLQTHVGDPQIAPLSDLISAAIDFYSTRPVTGLAGSADSDMLLFQFGCYDWGEGEMFEIDLTRQFIVADEVDDDAISQLHLTAYFDPDEDLRNVGASNLWCKGLGEAPAFKRAVLGSAALAVTVARRPNRLRVDWDKV